MIRIGFIGFSGQKFNEKEAKEIIDHIFHEAIQKYNQFTVVSGCTNLGIPKLVYEKAKTLNLKTIGIMCKKGYEYDLFPVDLIIAVGNNWGDESNAFLQNIDILYKIGGGSQSQKEFKKAKEMGIPSFEFILEAIN